ncbi:class I SAM-dependent methyltransferase [Litorisediminicola beolgyonensis]|uniref:Class I SAM-dependent methyltransferase n=1 Tax=Litorisediminicola beolgyonensis TaxID=1173614 RepID=A0ABW3ZIE9_9RHOB
MSRPGDILDTYERQAAEFDSQRSQVLFEKSWLDRFLERLPDAPRVLDVGCGSGRPIAAYLAAQGARVTGLDGAEAMIALARAHAPEGDWRHGDMREFDLGERFHGVLSWNAFFHLDRPDQSRAVAAMTRHLLPGGVLLLTVGPRRGEATGRVGGEPVYHASHSPAGYRRMLARHGLRITAFHAEDPECDRHSILLASAPL